MSLGESQTLVLNADYRPVSYFPLSLWSWQDAMQAVFGDRVDVVAEYDQLVRSPSTTMKLPSAVALRSYVALPILRRAIQERGAHVRSCGAAIARRSRQLDEHRHGLHGLQRRQGQPHARRMRPAAASDADGAYGTAALRKWSRISASRAARKLARTGLSAAGSGAA
jgi:hypothetical protein